MFLIHTLRELHMTRRSTGNLYLHASALWSEKSCLLRHMHVHLYTGSRLVVLGPSGIGKSLLLRAIASLDPLVEGQITLRTADKGVVR
jgi:ABC-type uncharacterized transport system fused permease/ATPase subunit